MALMRAADRVRRRAARIVEPHGITLQQYNVLRILEAAKEDGVPTLEVAARMIEETPGVTRLLDRLEAKAYIRRQRCPRDRRQHLCWLSGEGARVLESTVTNSGSRARARARAPRRGNPSAVGGVTRRNQLGTIGGPPREGGFVFRK